MATIALGGGRCHKGAIPSTCLTTPVTLGVYTLFELWHSAVEHLPLSTFPLHPVRPPSEPHALRARSAAPDPLLHPMAYDFDAQCVYNIPLALDPTLSHTAGLERQFARHRCKSNVSRCKDYIIGPMPPSEFMDYFFDLPTDSELTQCMSSENAFKSIPVRADSVEEICKPLVSAR